MIPSIGHPCSQENPNKHEYDANFLVTEKLRTDD